MRKELPKFFEQILNITEPWYIAKIEQQGNTNNIYVDFKKGAKCYTAINIRSIQYRSTHILYFSNLEEGNSCQNHK